MRVQPNKKRPVDKVKVTLLELGLSGAVAAGRDVSRLLEALERSTGPPEEWSSIETVLQAPGGKGKETRLRYDVRTKTSELVSYERAIRVTSRPGQTQNPLETLQCRPVNIVHEAKTYHVDLLKRAGYENKFMTFQQGKHFRWGKASVYVSKLYELQRPTDFTKNPVSDDWFVECKMLTMVEVADEAAATLLAIQSALEQRVVLTK